LGLAFDTIIGNGLYTTVLKKANLENYGILDNNEVFTLAVSSDFPGLTPLWRKKLF
jgi:hypothetical protein